MSDARRTSGLSSSATLCAGALLVFLGQRVLASGVAGLAITGLGAAGCVLGLLLRARAFARGQGDERAVEGRLLFAQLGVMLSLLLYAASTDAGLSLVSIVENARERASAVLSVAWVSVLLVSFATLSFMELAYARMPIAASVELRRVRAAAVSGLTLACTVIFLGSLSYVASERDVRKDLSYFKTTEPSAGTRSMLQRVEAPLSVILFFRRGDDVLEQVEPYFATLAKGSGQGSKLSYEVMDAALAPELARKHRISENGAVLLLQGEGEARKGQSFKVGATLLEARPQLKKLDALFQQTLTKLVRPERIARLTVGHGERNAQSASQATGDGTRVLRELWKRLHLKVEDLGVAQGLGSQVPDGTGAVIVVGPSEPFMLEEVDALFAYVRGGGRLLLLLDPGNDDGLDPLLEKLGLLREPGVVASETQHMRRRHDASDRVIVFSNGFSSHPTVTTAARYQDEVASIFVSAVALKKTDAAISPKPSVAFPLRSTPSFFRDLNANFEKDESEALGSVQLMAAVTLKGEGDKEGRVVVIGDGDFVTDKLATNNGNMMVFVDSLSWLLGNEELSAEVSSEEDVPIRHSKDEDKLWFYATTFAVPLPLVAVGAFMSRRRRRPRKEAT